VIELVRRTFDVDASVDEAWAHLARVESWPSWAHHIKTVTVTPPGLLTNASTGQIRLKGAARSTFRMEQFDPPRRGGGSGASSAFESTTTTCSQRRTGVRG